MTHLGVLIGEHDVGAADAEFGVTDASIGTGHAHDFGGSEDFLVEVDGLRRTFDDEIGSHGAVTFGNVVNWSVRHDWVLARLGAEAIGI